MTYRKLLVLLFFCLLYLIFSQHIDFYTSNKDPLLKELHKQLSQLHPKFENISINEGNKTYTINKKKIFICLKDEYGRYYNRNHLVYVILHEYSHVLCDEWDTDSHGEKFWIIFDGLLEDASSAGLYDSSIPVLENYCGHH